MTDFKKLKVLSFKRMDSADKKVTKLFNYSIKYLQPKKSAIPFFTSKVLMTHIKLGDWLLTFTKRNNSLKRIHLSASTGPGNDPHADYHTLEAAAHVEEDGTMTLEFVSHYHYYGLRSRFGFASGKFDVDSVSGTDSHATTLFCKTLGL